MDKLDQLCQKLEIPYNLVKEYSDNYTQQNVQGMVSLLSHPFVNNALNEMRAMKTKKLYNQFLQELFESFYAFCALNQLGFMDDFNNSYPKLRKFVREPDKRTLESDHIRNDVNKCLVSYIDELIGERAGCILKGSAYFGDSNLKSDGDILFYGNSVSNQGKELVSTVKQDLGSRKNVRQINVTGPYDLAQLNMALERMIQGQTEDIAEYYIVEHEGCLMTVENSYIHLLLGDNLYSLPSLEYELNKTRELLKEAITKDSILHFIVALDIAENIVIRKEKLKLDL